MNENNGVVRIKARSVKKFAIGEDGPVFELDVVRAYDEWAQIDASFRDAAGVVPKDQIVAWSNARGSFAEKVVADAYALTPQPQEPPRLDGGQVGDFMARLAEEVDKLKVFFEPKFERPQSSPQSSELRFSM